MVFRYRLRPLSPTTSKSLKSVGTLPPNTRMQRTRSSPSALRSPLMRCPLGSAKGPRKTALPGALDESSARGVAFLGVPGESTGMVAILL